MCGRTADNFVHDYRDKGCRTMICDCGTTMGPVVSFPNTNLYFEQGRPRTIWNLGPEPVTVRSHREHKEAMKKAGVVEAGALKNQKGTWV